MAYVYKFLDSNDKILYIGYTGQTMEQRMGQHFGGKGHLAKECYRSVAKIEYMPLRTKADAIVVESYLINKYKPFYNKQSKKNDKLTINISVEENWKLYKIMRTHTINKPVSFKGLLCNAFIGLMYVLIMLYLLINML